VLGGADEQRLEIARAFHLSSPLRRGPFHVLDCAREEALLARALQTWLIPGTTRPGSAPLHEVECGTLYLDAVECLSAPTQRLLLALARRLHGAADEPRSESGPVRLAVGSAEDLDEAAEQRRFSGALLDCLDKIRVDLGRVASRGAA
jgi:DNA-binding NtrC family response regulator